MARGGREHELENIQRVGRDCRRLATLTICKALGEIINQGGESLNAIDVRAVRNQNHSLKTVKGCSPILKVPLYNSLFVN